MTSVVPQIPLYSVLDLPVDTKIRRAFYTDDLANENILNTNPYTVEIILKILLHEIRKNPAFM